MDSRTPSIAFWSPLPPSPNPNPNPDPNRIPVPDPTSSSDLPTTISLLKSLISFANSTLTSISDLVPLSAFPSFIPCPFNSSHRMPPESLFRHSLLCSSAPGASFLDLAFLDSLRYPISSQSSAEATFPRSNPDGDLALSFDEPLDGSGSSFFYKGCHGVVVFPQSDASRRTFMLPAFLSSECSDFVAESSVDEGEKNVRVYSILPSDFFSLRCEVSAWIYCPVSYSYTVLRVASGLRKVDDLRLKRWIIMHSAVSGVVIDAAMSDHIYLLLKLCLKVIEREALCNFELHFRKDEFLGQGDRSFECPKLVGSFNWLASQLSVLYGDRNGNSFAVGMVKESLLCAGSCLMLFKPETYKFRQDGCGSGEGDDVDKGETGNSKLVKHSQAGSEVNVSVSQVIAAISALHERSLVEEKTKFLRFGRPITKAQLITEHSFISTRSSAERTKRPAYKAVLEHDGLLWQRAQDQGACKEKTKEELLAEERDYKRRRMSYRGKKIKRTLTQVIRDIIDEHMEEIKQAGGIGCGVKATQEMARTAGFHELERRSGTIETEAEADPSFHKKPLYGEYNANSGVHGDVWRMDVSSADHIMQKPYNKWRHQEDYRKRNNDRVRNSGFRNPSHSNDDHPHEKYADRKAVDYDEEHSSKYDKRDQGYSVKSKDHQSRSMFTSISAKTLAEEEHHHTFKGCNRHRNRNPVRRRSASMRPNGFEDRYDPRNSHDEFDSACTDVSAGSNSVRSARYVGSSDDDKYEIEPHKGEIAAKRRKWDHHAK